MFHCPLKLTKSLIRSAENVQVFLVAIMSVGYVHLASFILLQKKDDEIVLFYLGSKIGYLSYMLFLFVFLPLSAIMYNHCGTGTFQPK